MASNEDLNQMFNEGRLGAFLADKFRGRLSAPYPRRDSDFMIIFESETEVPDIESLKDAVHGLYETQGYKIENLEKYPESLELRVFFDDPTRFSVFVVISTNYPDPQPMEGGTSIRVSTQNI
ncbi:MAG: hypothetical protein RLY43_1304 [Bacteroidota bacterium]